MITQNGLPGFFEQYHNNIASWVYEFSLSPGTVEHVQISMKDKKKLINQLSQFESSQGKEILLRLNYPEVYKGLVWQINTPDKLSKILTVDNFTRFIQEELGPFLASLRRQGKLVKDQRGSIAIGDTKMDYDYIGEQDKFGNAIGEGQANGQYQYSGTFINNTLSGITVGKLVACTVIQERKNNKLFGKMTKYYDDGDIFNEVYENDKFVSRKIITAEPESAFFTK